ncbi:TetR/AcrR family transcriptional regulator [Roseomonas sp. SSH11]|uniref:TetR/AcrR family transcriptional regulator n=1 Tax=Pararoseomonas baculiformis TaxID=2820812 RepID=A0ABS4ACW4_9PROT|nr:TetR/AcrR family transcriptional regulator [Pararoseomonas baculiformis]MBP0444838.1 TetR/AcrR family transcriptional regulator [Pararoseomonas baculiformis]
MPPDAPPSPDRPDLRTRVLDAAEAIIRARGVPALTLEGAAREAGVSKGGLLYHFASKEALLVALMRRLAQGIEADFRAIVAAQPEGPHRALRACLAFTFDQPDISEAHARAAAVLLAAFHHDPALIDPIREFFAQVRAEVALDGTAPGVAWAVMLAGDGLFMARLFRLYEPNAAELAALRATLHGLLEGGS